MKDPVQWHRQFFPGILDHFENKDSLVNANVECSFHSTNIILQDVTPPNSSDTQEIRHVLIITDNRLPCVARAVV
jgi:hypothetical protein